MARLSNLRTTLLVVFGTVFLALFWHYGIACFASSIARRSNISRVTKTKDARGTAARVVADKGNSEIKEVEVAGSNTSTAYRVGKKYGELPLNFEANKGQAEGQVKYLSRGAGYNLLLTPQETILKLYGDKSQPDQLRGNGKSDLRDGVRLKEKALAVSQKADFLRLRLVGANPNARIYGKEQLAGKSNFFYGSDSAKWVTDVPNYAQVKYENVYPGIDVVYYGNQRNLEYDFIVSPGADPNAIQLEFEGQQNIQLARKGDLLIKIGERFVRQHKPSVYQEIAGQRREVKGHYVLSKSKAVKFRIGRYDASYPLIIDPVISYSTYWHSLITSLATGTDGSLYVTGTTGATDLATVNPLQVANAGGSDVFIQKLNPAGTAVLYSTYLGGVGEESSNAIAIDLSGQIYVAGNSSSTDFPTANAYDSTLDGGLDGFICKINSAGNALLYSTFLGGAGTEYINGLAVDGNGKAYVIGGTTSTNFPLVNPLQAAPGGNVDLFITSLNAGGNSLAFSTYFGGSDFDANGAIAVNSAGNVYFSCVTYSPNLPTVNAFQPSLAAPGGLVDADSVVGKIDVTGTSFNYLSYLGGSRNDEALDIAVDSAGYAYVVGRTYSSDFPTVNAYQPTKPVNLSGDPYSYAEGFVTKVGLTGTTLSYSTYLGGNKQDAASAVAVDAYGNA